MNSNSKDTNGYNGLPSDAELARLDAMINSEQAEESSEKDVAEILAQLNDAELVVERMENSLDRLNERLDGILEGLEAAQPATETTTEGQTQSDVSEANQAPPEE
ncbi:uncharacterized protein FOMMEDRAFT_154575 [Fomitiporia mediterranea MF3/22]|uniref:uncharacterized protein n=1 Tax=Fomitiporia mediterranea (strain MF3/22) TaxID=694068 RepID=UPI00044085D2|nr:uncharacterized protein FOMMEDRAFT_154575 [Fomitiporia mediterranea MF3/22]EJD03500.1 hypothetical protein FOMMEDRAFT_154575 [Fomitiporia mediterranea MF3/22]